MKIIIHRGSQEVGGNCVELHSGRTRLILDVGMPLFDEHHQPLDSFQMRKLSQVELLARGILPAVDGLFGEGSTPDAILLSHAHLDHVGLLHYTRNTIPTYASSGTSKMMLAGSLFAGQSQLPRDRFREIVPEVKFEIGDFTIVGFSVDHSIYGGLAFFIEADGKRVLYSGDLRLHGRKPGMARRLIEFARDNPVDVLLMEGTHFSFPDGNPANEYDLEDEIAKVVDKASSLILASFSPQHVDRLVAFIRTAIKTKRTFVADVYTAFIIHLLSRKLRLPTPSPDGTVRVYVPETLRQAYNGRGKSKIVDQFKDSQIELEEILASPEKYLMVFRPSMMKDFGGELPGKSCCLYSRWRGYLEQADWQTVQNSLSRSGGAIQELHTSGHILAGDIIRFVNEIAPRKILPIHTFNSLRFSQNWPSVIKAEDGVEIVIE